jgi:hypothetical protein
VPVGGAVGEIDVVAADHLLPMLEKPNWGQEFHRRYPDKVDIVIFSAPIYPVARQAVVYVLDVVTAATVVGLVREGQTWNVRAHHGLWIS